MFMPCRENADIAWSKIVGYLLNDQRPEGQDQARVLKRYGYSEGNALELWRTLLTLARSTEYVESSTTRHGIKYVFEDEIPTPSGKPLHLRMIWQINHGSQVPHFVTAYPIPRKRGRRQS